MNQETGNPQSPLLRAALDAAKAGEAVIRQYYQAKPQVAIKPDHSPVTQADIETEAAIAAVLRAVRPDYGFFGEESGHSRGPTGRGPSECLWLVDPIDGTKSFIREMPFFSTQIALLCGGSLTLGVSNAPLFDELAWAERGLGAFLNGRRLAVSALDRLEDATLSLGNIRSLARDRRWNRLAELVGQVNRSRGYGDFYHYHLLAAGKLDVVLESDVNILDVAALSVIVTEAGGTVTDLEGRPLDLNSTSILATNGHLHQPVLDRLNG